MKYFRLLPVWFLLFVSVSAQPYTILVSFDGMRWDYVNRNITPTITALQQQGVSALSLRPSFPSKTFPNHLTLVTGVYPSHHGILYNEFLNPKTGERYKMSDTAIVRNAKWYNAEMIWETAARQGIKTASCFWPCSDVHKTFGMPTYFKSYNPKYSYAQRVEDALDWLRLPLPSRPQLIALYFEEIDTQGHLFGPNSPQVNFAVQQMDSILGLLIRGIKKIGLLDSTNIILVSDHGMTDIDTNRVINIESIIGNLQVQYSGYGQVVMIQPRRGEEEQVFLLLKQHEKHYTVYKKEMVPNYYKFSDNNNILPIIIVAELGWTLTTTELSFDQRKKFGKGTHGYETDAIDMHGIFIAAGPSFKNGYQTGTLWNIDVYPLLCALLKIQPSKNIDGNIDRIGFLLR
jgi:predicted AlkP superfamily pyrophosphatase or phosphodiesterase